MKKLTFALIALLSSLPLMAAESEPTAATEIGKQTRDALALQRSGQAASTTERPMSGDVADRTYRRYAESFSQPIPKSFDDEEQEFVKGSE